MSYVGDFALGVTFDVKFTTRRFSTGAPFALSGGTIVAYPDNSTTEVTGGITLGADHDGVTGLNQVRVVATSGNGYASGSNYALVISAGTVDSVSVVGEVIAQFSIEARSSLRPTTAGRTLDVSAGGEAGVDWANIGSPTTAVNLSATNIDVDQVVASVTNIAAQTGDSFARLGAPAGASIAADIAGISAASAGRIVDSLGGQLIKQSTAYTRIFRMRSSSDHATPVTGAAPVVTLSKAGGAFAAAGGTVTEIASGWYYIALSATDTNTAGQLAYHITGTGADDVDFVDQVFPTVVFR
jgi:hypothetical protein